MPPASVPPAPVRPSLPRRLVRWAVRLGVLFVMLNLALLVFTETGWFRSMARDLLVSTVDSTLYARLDIGDISGNLFSGWEIRDVRLTTDAGPLVAVRSIVVRYNLFSIPWKKIDVMEVTLNQPVITLTRADGRGWNFEHLSRDTTESEGGTFDWRVIVRTLRIVDGRLVMRDSTDSGPFAPNRLSLSNLDLDHLSLAVQADIAPARKVLSINQCSFDNRSGEVSLSNLAGDIRIDRARTEVRNLSLVTNRSRLLLTAVLDSMSVLEGFTYEAFKTTPVLLSLEAPVVDTRDLQYFLPALDFLGSTAAIDLEARGSMRALAIERLDLRTALSRISFAGTLADIDAGVDIRIDVASTNSIIDPSDLPTLLPGIPLPDYSLVGPVRFEEITYSGRPLDFTASVDFTSDAGSGKGRAALDITGEDLVYDATVETRALDLSKIFKVPALSSALTARGTVKGRGTTLGRMSADISLQVDSSRYQRYTARSLAALLSVRPDSVGASVQGDFVQSAIALTGSLRLARDSVTGFNVLLRSNGLDLGRVLGDDSLSSDLNFVLSATGDGLDPATLSGEATMLVQPSTLMDFHLAADTMRFVVDQRTPGGSRLSLGTQYADLSLAGRFDLVRFADFLSEQTDSLGAAWLPLALASAPPPPVLSTPRAIRRAAADEARRRRDEAARLAAIDTSSFMQATWELHLKNPDRFARLINTRTAFFKGDLRGTIRGGWNGMSLAGSIDMTDMYYVSDSLSFGSAGLRCTYRIDGLTPRATLDRLDASIDLRVGDASLNSLRVGNVGMRFLYADRAPRLALRGVVQDDYALDIDATGHVQDTRWDVLFSRLGVKYKAQQWLADVPAPITIDTAGVHVPQLRLRRGGSAIRISGTRAFAGTNAFTIRLDSMRVGDLEYLATGQATSLQEQGFSGLASIVLDVGGTDAAPVLALDAFVDRLGYQGAEFGELTLEATYSAERLELYSELEYPVSATEMRKVFFASGSMPVAISFTGEAPVAAGSANLRVQMKKFPLPLVERFIGLFSPLEGYADADLTLSGGIEDAEFGGWLEVADARGRFLTNNMVYLMQLRLEPKGTTINVKTTLQNAPTERNPGIMTATGTIATERFQIGQIDLDIAGRLKVLRKASRSAFKTMYGDLYVASGPAGLRYHGRLEKSHLDGDLHILEGDLTFPSENDDARTGDIEGVTYLDVDDVTAQRTTSLSAARERARSSLFANGNGSAADSAAQVRTPSILDAMDFDISVTTIGSLVVSMPISSLSQQELNARLDIRNFRAERKGGAQKYIGEVQLGSGSRYLFLGKPFRATGSLTFLRDLGNPDLNLRAVYTEYHTPPSGTGEERRRVFVILTITGTLNEPRLAWDIRFDSESGTQRPRGGNLDSDALAFVLFGLFSDELSVGEKGGKGRVIDQTGAIASALGNAYLSSTMTDLLSRAGLQDVVKRVEFDRLDSQKDARLKLTGSIGQALLIYDGKINNLGSSDIVLEIPLGELFPSFGFRNMVVQFAKRTANGALEGGSANQESNIYEGKILYRFSF